MLISRIPRPGRLLSVSSDNISGEMLLTIRSPVAVYLAHVLRITPAPIVSDLRLVLQLTYRSNASQIRDIIAFVMSKRLTGRKFLRFRFILSPSSSVRADLSCREQDFKNLDINPAWAVCLIAMRLHIYS